MKRFLILLCSLCLAGLMACGLNNTMYNARNYFKSAQARPLNTNGKPNAQAIDEYTKTIKKCGIIISERRKGAQMDDAVFLMAKALYFKGNSAFQAKDQFDNLILSFPDSPFVAESHIFIARILREINQPKEADKRLDEFIFNPRFRKDHPKALLLMTDFAIKDKDYARAQYWLERIIRDYPKTKEFREAYFLFGKNYYEQKDFTRSLDAFEKMRNARGIDKGLKLDASYYIALNQFELGELDKAFRSIKSLAKNESRPERIPFVRVLKARILFAIGESDDAKAEIEFISKTYPRTESAAAAYYYRGEYYYYKAGDHAKAIADLNRVRTEFSTSPLASLGQNKATAITKVSPDSTLNSETALQAYLDYYYQGAESFLSHLALPDSALAYYQQVILQRDVLVARRDSLQIAVDSMQVALDSLTVETDSLKSAIADSMNISITDSIQISVADSTKIKLADSLPVPVADSMNISPADSLQTPVADSTKINLVGTMQSSETDSTSISLDSLKVQIDNQASIPDSVSVDFGETAQLDSLASPVIDSLALSLAQSRQQQKTKLEADLLLYNNKIQSLSELVTRFDAEIIPFCLFAMGSVLHDYNPESPRNAEVLAQLQGSYANNKFSKALFALQNGQPVRLIDPLEEAQEGRLDDLFGSIAAQPDSALAGLQELSGSDYPTISLAANYRLGWYYSFEAVDTLAAVSYLKAVLDSPNGGDYATVTRRFYDGNKFLLRGAEISEIIDSLAVPLDSLDFAPADSLGKFRDIPAMMDSLAMGIPPAVVVADSLRKNLVPLLGLDEDVPQEIAPPSPAPTENPELIPSQPEMPPTLPEIQEEDLKLE